MKKCNKCNQEKDYSEFSKCKANLDGYQSKCKACAKVYFKANKEKIVKQSKDINLGKKDGYYSVYLLPYEHYVGTTDNVYHRMCGHRSIERDTSSYIILGRFKQRNEALQLEKIYHSEGYIGKHIKNAYK